jgi:hypothetical protein
MTTVLTRIAAALLGVAAATAQAPIVSTVLSNGTTQSRYDMVILGDGYRASEQARFDSDVQTFLTALFQRQPYQTFAAYYNVHTVFRASVDSGADRPDETPPVFKNTVYDASYNIGGTDRCLYIQNTSLALADAALAPANEGRVLVFVNDTRYGGCASTFAVSYNGGSMTEVQIHELGHSLGGLADEYDYAGQTYSGGEPGEENATTSSTGQKWSHWHGFDGVSAFQGAKYHQYGLWRPRNNCLMRNLGQPLCAVCKEQISKLTNSIVDAIPQQIPTATDLTLNTGVQQPFSIAHIVPAGNAPLVAWRVDGAVVPGATGLGFTLDTTNLSLGAHTVQASVQDRTALVRLDPQQVMRETQTWNLTIADPLAAQLRIPSFALTTVWVQPGTIVLGNTTVANDGPNTATGVTVEWFLGTATAWSANDTYLGSHTVPTLAPGQQVLVSRNMQLPWRLADGVHYVHAVVDRTDTVRETNEGDNRRVTAVVSQPGPCVTKFEYDDPLVYPHDSASLGLTAGGTLHPTVVARCAQPGTLYLIVWGCSGTTPGTSIAPGVTVPINQDFCTGLGLGLLNTPMFAQFFGVLDAQGLGRATFALPPATGLPPSPGHFAALLIDPAGAFGAVTDPIVIDLQ